MKILVTGASGFIGIHLCQRLANENHDVIALYRNRDRQVNLIHPNIKLVRGDVNSLKELAKAVQGCEIIFHLAALARPWAKNALDFQTINCDGTRNVFRAGSEAQVNRIVFASTAGVFGASIGNTPTNETQPLADQLDSDYERSKKSCEAIVSEFQATGSDIVTLYPTRVYGPGILTTSNSLTKIFDRFEMGKWRTIPGDGNSIGNYVFIDDVVDGFCKAMSVSKPNERYLIGGENLSFNQIVVELQSTTGRNHRMLNVPRSVLNVAANVELLKANSIGRPPKITPGFVNKYLSDWIVDCSKAKSDLGYRPVSFTEGLQRTIDWIRSYRRSVKPVFLD
ncbi:MAG: NAD-dependent epimerase/dehydratase family protein [Mariniblastus sp.]